MLPVLVHFTFLTPASQAVAYLLGVVIIAYSAYAGWHGAVGPPQKKRGKGEDKLVRGAIFGLLGAAVARIALLYMLPPAAFLGGTSQGLPIHTYGLMLAAGFLLAVRVSAAIAEREWRLDGHERRNQILDLSFWVLLGGVGGAHLLFMLVNWRETGNQISLVFSDPSKLFDVLFSGLVFQGGLLGAMAVSYLYARRHNMDFFRLSDVAAPTVSLGSALGRLGCFSAGCCWGDVVPKGKPFGLWFPGPRMALDLFGQQVGASSLAFESQRADPRFVVEESGKLFHQAVPGAVKVSEWVAQHGHTLPVYPTQILDSLGNLLLFVGALALRRYRRFHGQILALWLMGYSALRTSVELLRGDVERGTLHGLLDAVGGATWADKVSLEAWYNISTGQFISLCMFGLGVTLLVQRGRIVRQRNRARATEPVSA